MQNPPDRREKADFNMAVSYLNRLNELFQISNYYSQTLNFYGWLHSLNALYRELITEMNKEELTYISRLKAKATYLVNDGLNKRKQNNTADPQTYTALEEYEIEIRRVLKSSGLLMKMQEQAGLALKWSA